MTIDVVNNLVRLRIEKGLIKEKDKKTNKVVKSKRTSKKKKQNEKK